MKRGWKLMGGPALVGGAGLGAAFMYLFDPDCGKQRRAVLRNRILHGVRSSGDTLGVVSRSLANRSRGLLARARSRSPLVPEPVSDPVLAERVRSQIGHAVTHAGAIGMSVREGRVTLTGRVLCGEVRRLLKRVSRVPGVTCVENELEACEPGTWALQDKVTPEARPQ
jgi:BON domain